MRIKSPRTAEAHTFCVDTHIHRVALSSRTVPREHACTHLPLPTHWAALLTHMRELKQIATDSMYAASSTSMYGSVLVKPQLKVQTGSHDEGAVLHAH